MGAKGAAMLRRALWYVGRRGAFLIFLAELDTIIAYSLVAPLPYGLSPAQVYGPFQAVMPIWAWAGIWLGVGLLAGVAACWHVVRPAVFALSAALKTGWGLLYLTGWLGGDLLRGYLSTAIWWTFAAVVLVVSSWSERAP